MGYAALAGCPTQHRHRFEIRGAVRVAGIALRCPNCAPSSPVADLAEMVATRRRTLAGLAGLPTPVRSDLAATGTLAQLYSDALTEVRTLARRCADEHGVEPPAALGVDPADRDAVRTALDLTADWVGVLNRPN